MNECGLGEFNSSNLNKLLQSKFVSVFPSISHYSQNMSGSLPPKNMEEFFQLLHLRFTQPRKDTEAFASFIARQRESLINSERDPQNAYRDSVSAILGNYHPRSMPFTVSDLEKFELDRAYNIYKERFSDASNFTFLFVGAFTNDEIKPFIEQYIASLPATNKNEKYKDLNIKSPTGQVNKIIRKGIEHKATVNIFMDTDGVNFTSDELLKMNAMREIANILLREEIREEKGGTYGIRISANMVPVPQPYVRINISFGCEP
jgi:zinc protease